MSPDITAKEEGHEAGWHQNGNIKSIWRGINQTVDLNMPTDLENNSVGPNDKIHDRMCKLPYSFP